MEKVVIDSCIFIKLFVNENDSDIALAFFDKLLSNKTKILVPELFYYEVLAACIKNNINLELAGEIIGDYEKSILKFVKPTGLILKKAHDITLYGSEKSGFPSFYDSLYHALAICEETDFFTSDKKYYAKVKDIIP